jgi:hypothetical protein
MSSALIRWLSVLGFLMLATAGSTYAAPPSEGASAKNVVVHLSKYNEDPHAVLMALTRPDDPEEEEEVYPPAHSSTRSMPAQCSG